MKRSKCLLVMSVVLLLALLVSACQPIVVTESTGLEPDIAPPEVEVSPGGEVYEVYPTNDPEQDIANVQAAIDGAEEGDTILLKAGTFNFGAWQTNPIPGGFVMINRGVTVRGDGLDADGNPKTIIQGGNYRQKNHWEHGEYGVFTFGGETSGAVLDGIWFKEPHFYAVFISGFNGQTHENITVRNLKITDITSDIPEWDQNAAIGRSIDMGANVPEWDIGGPTGTVTIENCYISNMGSLLDLDFVDPDTGTLYYTDPEGQPLPAQHNQASHAIGLWINMSANFVVRNNTIRGQHEGIVMEYMSGSGDILIADNDIVVETAALIPNLQRGIRLTTCDAEEFPFASRRTVRIENNRIAVVGTPGEDFISEGILLSNDNGVEGFEASYVVTGNEIDIQDGYAAIVMGSSIPAATLRGAEISANRISGTAEYGIVSTEGAQYNKILANDMSGFEPGVANVGLYGSETHQNLLRGNLGTVDEGLGAYRNEIVREAMAEPAEVVESAPVPETAPREITGEVHFTVPEWGDMQISMNFDIQEVDPTTHEASGFCNWRNYTSTPPSGGHGWKGIDSQVKYVTFGQDVAGGDPNTAVIVTQITHHTGWGWGEPGEYAYFWVRDSGRPGGEGDQWGMLYYSLDPWIEFFPADDPPPSDGYFGVEEMKIHDPPLPIDVELGDLVIEPAGGTVPAPSEVVSQAETVQAESSARTLKGEFQFPSPAAWPVDLWITFDVDIHQLDPETHEADGVVNWGVYYFEHDEWKRIKSDVEYVFFDEDGKAAVFVTQIREKTGPGEGEPGEHACYWVRDGELGDQFGIHYYHETHPEAGFKEFWPEDELPELAYTEPQLPIDVELGDLIVVR